MEATEKIFAKFEYLAPMYANRVFEYEQLGYEYQDVLQEFRIKIYTTIESYLNRLREYNSGELAKKPIPIKFYIQSACSNKLRDFIKYINKENHKVSLDEINYDYGISQESIIEPENNLFIVNGVDLLENLKNKQRAVFSLYLRGYGVNILNRVYFSNSVEKELKKQVIKDGDIPIDAMDIVREQCNYLIAKYGNDLSQAQRVFQTYQIEED